MVAVSFLVENWEKIKNFITGANETLEETNKKLKRGRKNDRERLMMHVKQK